MKKTNQEKNIDWSLTTWEGAQKEKLRHWSSLSLREILLAQEEMQKISDQLHENK